MTALDLHPVTGSNRFCAPAVLATLAGITTDEAAATIAAMTGENAATLEGVRPDPLVAAASTFGVILEEPAWFDAYEGTWSTPPSLLDLDDDWITDGVWVIFMRDPGHYCVVSFDDHTRTVIDNETKTAVPITDYKFKDAVCTIVWRVDS
jgi:hypothetical protein